MAERQDCTNDNEEKDKEVKFLVLKDKQAGKHDDPDAAFSQRDQPFGKRCDLQLFQEFNGWIARCAQTNISNGPNHSFVCNVIILHDVGRCQRSVIKAAQNEGGTYGRQNMHEYGEIFPRRASKRCSF